MGVRGFTAVYWYYAAFMEIWTILYRIGKPMQKNRSMLIIGEAVRKQVIKAQLYITYIGFAGFQWNRIGTGKSVSETIALMIK
jgi:hypothetical protein